MLFSDRELKQARIQIRVLLDQDSIEYEFERPTLTGFAQQTLYNICVNGAAYQPMQVVGVPHPRTRRWSGVRRPR